MAGNLGLSPPAELQAFAAVLQEALPPEREPSPEYSPTDLAAPLTPTLEEDEEEGPAAAQAEDASMHQKREAEEAAAPGPAARPRRDVDSGPYARPQQRAASR